MASALESHLPEISDEELEPERRRCLLRGMGEFAFTMSLSFIGKEHYASSPSQKGSDWGFLIFLPIGVGLGYLFASHQWRAEEQEKCRANERLRRRGEVRRIPLKRRAGGLETLVCGGIGAGLIIWDLGWRHTPVFDYFPLAILAVLVTAVQFWLNRQHIELDYLAATCQPPPVRTLGQDLRRYWYVALLLILMNTQGILKVISLFFVCLTYHYPLQRWMYLRSQHEFGKSGPAER